MKHLKLASFITSVAAISAVSAQTAPTPTTVKPEAETVVLSPFNVSTKQDRGYATSSSLGGSRVAIPLGDISSSVIVLNEQFLRDRGAVDAPEALVYVSGVQRGSDANPGQEQFSLRGYSINGISLRDGLPGGLIGADFPVDESSSYERLEVIKGPAGTLYGSHSMGGIVNKVSKWPKLKRETSLQFTAQSYEKFLQTVIDTTGPLTDKLAYRATLSARKGDRFFSEGDAPNDTYNLTATTTYLFGKRGHLGKAWVRGQYLDISLDREQGLQFITGYLPSPLAATASGPIVRNGKFPLSVKANVVPDDDISKQQNYFLEAGYERSLKNLLGGNWNMRLVARATDADGDKSPSYAQGRPVPVDASGAIVRYTNASGLLANGDSRFVSAGDPRVADWRSTLVLRDFRGFNRSKGAFLDIVGDFKTSILTHKLVLSGTASGRESSRAFFFWNALNPLNTTAVANSFSAVNPTPAGVKAMSIKSSSAAKQFNAFNGHTLGQGYSFAFQDNISALENRLIYVFGARHDEFRSTADRFDTQASLLQDRFVINPALRTWSKGSANTTKNGLIVKPFSGDFSDVSVFGSVNQTFNPISSFSSVTGKKNPDQRGKSKEAGLKTDLWGGRLVGTFSYFKNELTNVLIAVVNPIELGGGTVSVPAGLQKTDGYEFDLAAEPVAGLNLLASFSKLTSKDENGRFFRNVPKEPNYAFFARYSFRKSAVKGASVGLGYKRYGAFAGDATNTFFITGSGTFDGFVGYERNNWGVQINVANLTSNDAMFSTVSDTIVQRYLPRTFRLTLRYKL